MWIFCDSILEMCPQMAELTNKTQEKILIGIYNKTPYRFTKSVCVCGCVWEREREEEGGRERENGKEII